MRGFFLSELIGEKRKKNPLPVKRCVGSKGDYLKRVGSGGLLQRLKRHDEAWMDPSLKKEKKH